MNGSRVAKAGEGTHAPRGVKQLLQHQVPSPWSERLSEYVTSRKRPVDRSVSHAVSVSSEPIAPHKGSGQSRKKAKKQIMSVPRAVFSSFPANRRVKLRYSSVGSFACTAGAVGSYLFSANSAYDPDYTGSGHQPLGFDQWAIFYRSYIVEKAKIRVEFLNYSAFQAVAGILLDNNASIPSTGDLIMEQPTCESRLIFAQNPPYTKPTVFVKTVSMSDWFNVRSVLDDVARFGAKTTADPTNVCYFALWGRELGATSTTNIYFKVLLEQTVVFSEPNDLPSS